MTANPQGDPADWTDLVVATGNTRKATEMAEILGHPVRQVDLDLPEIQAVDVEVVARAKVLAAFAVVRRPVIVDDSGLALACLNGLPGALGSWFLSRLGSAGVLRLAHGATDRAATMLTCIAYTDGVDVRTFVGQVHGTLALELRGRIGSGFGIDPFFIPDGWTRTFGEATPEEKHAISARAQALRAFRDFWRARSHQS